MPELLTGLTTGANFASTILNNVANRRLAEYQAETNYNQILDMWNRTNAYNTPAAQMARYEAAGLNPHLIYGRDNTTQQASVGTYQRPEMIAPRFDLLMRKEELEGKHIDNLLKMSAFNETLIGMKAKALMLQQMYQHNAKMFPYQEGLKQIEFDLRDQMKGNLEKKYKFENYFYDQNLNPYNSSLIGGSINLGLGIGKSVFDWLTGKRDNILGFEFNPGY